jgi:phosphomannomutase
MAAAGEHPGDFDHERLTPSRPGQPRRGPAVPDGLRATVQAWIDDDPDPDDRDELRKLLADGGQTAAAELASRFGGRLEFGTAGLRGAVAAGPARMNRAVVREATAALAGWLAGRVPGAAQAGVAIGADARHRSAEFADEAAQVLAGAGFRVHLLPRPGPTPLLAFSVRQLSAAAGVMITASHNPAADNGYKLYLGDGAQIIPPADAEVEAAIRALGPLSAVAVAPLDSPLITRHGTELAGAYLDAVTALPGTSPPGPGAGAPLRVVYTAMHGVAGPLMLAAIARAGFPAPHVVAAQGDPDPDFPTVAFPNPEEPGALDLALAEARRLGADLVLASDPDGDRLAVAVPDPASGSGWRRLTGDQLGALLGGYLLRQTAGEPDPAGRLVVTTIVSATLLPEIAAAAGARHAETLTGFKWIVRAGEGGRGGGWGPGSRFLFGYEEALGYAVGEAVRDKDGIGAALAVLGLAARERQAGRSLLDAYDALETAHGVHLTAQLTLRTAAPGQIMTALRAAPPASFGGEAVLHAEDLAGGAGGLPPSDVLVYRLAGARIVVRPSGTEPKLKVYFEVTGPAGADLGPARRDAAARLDALQTAAGQLVTAGRELPLAAAVAERCELLAAGAEGVPGAGSRVELQVVADRRGGEIEVVEVLDPLHNLALLVEHHNAGKAVVVGGVADPRRAQRAIW